MFPFTYILQLFFLFSLHVLVNYELVFFCWLFFCIRRRDCPKLSLNQWCIRKMTRMYTLQADSIWQRAYRIVLREKQEVYEGSLKAQKAYDVYHRIPSIISLS